MQILLRVVGVFNHECRCPRSPEEDLSSPRTELPVLVSHSRRVLGTMFPQISLYSASILDTAPLLCSLLYRSKQGSLYPASADLELASVPQIGPKAMIFLSKPLSAG